MALKRIIYVRSLGKELLLLADNQSRGNNSSVTGHKQTRQVSSILGKPQGPCAGRVLVYRVKLIIIWSVKPRTAIYNGAVVSRK